VKGVKRTIAVVAAFGAAYAGYGVYRAGLNEAPPPPTNQQIVFHNGIAGGQRITTKSWTADYDRIVSNSDQTILELDGVRNGTIFRAGKPYLRVTATHLSVNTVSHDFSATGPIHVETLSVQPPRAFDTTSAIWNDGTQTLSLARHVTIRTGAAHPLEVGSLTFVVKTGQLEMRDVAGPVRFK
jgi:hypothetical protein